MSSGRNYVKKVIFFLLCSISFFANAQQVPVPEWVKDIGGSGESKVTGIAVDKSDNVYVSGNFQGLLKVDNSGTQNPVMLQSNGDYDIFIAKYTNEGELLWAKSFGGSDLDQGNNLAIDIDGNAYIAAFFNSGSIDCDPGPAIHQVVNKGGFDAILIKFSPDGEFIWERTVAGSDNDRGHVVATDKDGNVMLVGSFGSEDLSIGGKVLKTAGDLDGFIVKYNRNGTPIFAFSIGDILADEITSVKTDSQGNIIISGYFANTVNMNPAGAPQSFYAMPPGKPFVAKYAPNGLLIWLQTLENNPATLASLAVSYNDNIYITGQAAGSVAIFSPSKTVSTVVVGNTNIFVMKIDANGIPVWARSAGSNDGTPYSYYITTDVDENIYIGGFFSNTLNFSDQVVAKSLTGHAVGRETFFVKYTANGNLGWNFNFGSECNGNFGHKIAVDSKKNVLLGGAFCNTVDFNVANCDLNVTAQNSASDGFLSKFNQTIFDEPVFTAFEMDEQYIPAAIIPQNKTIRIKLNIGTDLTKLKPRFAVNAGATSPASEAEVDLSNSPFIYTISYNCFDTKWKIIATLNQIEQHDICSGTGKILAVEQDINSTYLWETYNGSVWVTAPGISNTYQYEFPGFVNNTNANISVKYRAKTTQFGVDFYSNEQELIVHPVTKDNVITTIQTLFCNGNAVSSITGSDPQGAQGFPMAYQWQQSPDGIAWVDIAGKNSRDLLTDEFYSNTYFRRITITGNCSAYSNSLFIEVYATTTPDAGKDIILCNTKTVTLHANSVSAIETGAWRVLWPLNYQPFDASNINNPNAVIGNLPQNETVRLQWSITNNNCHTTKSDELEVLSLGDINLKTPGILYVYPGESINLGAKADLAANQNYKITWAAEPGLNNYNILNPAATPKTRTTYTVTVKYGLDCSSTAQVTVAIMNDVVAPNAFTPNGDGVNDSWTLKNIAEYPNARVYVYNRFGDLVFTSVGYPNPWDGTISGKKAPIGTYYYTIQLNDRKNKVYKGSVTIIH